MAQPEIRRDAVRTLRAAAADTGLLLEAADSLPGFNHPALVVWASGDRVMPAECQPSMASASPNSSRKGSSSRWTIATHSFPWISQLRWEVPMDNLDDPRISAYKPQRRLLLPAPPGPRPKLSKAQHKQKELAEAR